jgi:hypothetical protein
MKVWMDIALREKEIPRHHDTVDKFDAGAQQKPKK